MANESSRGAVRSPRQSMAMGGAAVLRGVSVYAASALFSLLVASAAQAVPKDFDAIWRDVASRYQLSLRQEGVVGATLAFAQDGKVLKTAHYGFADQASGRAVDDETIYHWASCTKMFTAIAIMQLRDRGLLSLDDRIVDYLPETKQIHDPYGPISVITLRHLITHSSGLRSPTFPWGGTQEWYPHEPAKWSQVAAMMPYTEIEFEPGSKFGYSNLGLSMLGRVVEEVTGDDIAVYIDKNILKPLGMTRAYFDATPLYLLKARSNNYYLKDGKLRENGLEVITGATMGNGGLNAPVPDMMKFASFLLGVRDNGNYEHVLSRKSLMEMWRPGHSTQDNTVTEHMGMAFFVVDHAGAGQATIRYVGHTGGQMGFRSFVYIRPETKTAAILSMNTSNLDVPRDDSSFIRIREDVLSHLFLPFEAERR